MLSSLNGTSGQRPASKSRGVSEAAVTRLLQQVRRWGKLDLTLNETCGPDMDMEITLLTPAPQLDYDCSCASISSTIHIGYWYVYGSPILQHQIANITRPDRAGPTYQYYK